MSSELRLTTKEVADSLRRTAGINSPVWKIRRVVDGLEAAGVIDVQRMGLYRTIAATDVGTIASKLRKTEVMANVG